MIRLDYFNDFGPGAFADWWVTEIEIFIWRWRFHFIRVRQLELGWHDGATVFAPIRTPMEPFDA